MWDDVVSRSQDAWLVICIITPIPLAVISVWICSN